MPNSALKKLFDIPSTRSEEMAEISADAFIDAEDPIGNFIFQDEPDRYALKRRFFRSLVHSCPPNAIRKGTSPDLEAVSIWFPPGMDHSEDTEADTFAANDFESNQTMERLQAVNEVIATLTADLGSQAQWYLHLVAVSPQFQGQGYASTLIKPMLARADEEHCPCSLITQSLANVKKYERWGFKIVKEISVPQSDEHFYSMRRE